MVRGRLWRVLMIFLNLCITLSVYFFHLFKADINETTTLSSLAHVNAQLTDSNSNKKV